MIWVPLPDQIAVRSENSTGIGLHLIFHSIEFFGSLFGKFSLVASFK